MSSTTFLINTFKHGKATLRCPQSLFFSKLNSSSCLNSSSQEMFWTGSPILCLLLHVHVCLELGPSKLADTGDISWEQSRGGRITSFNLLATLLFMTTWIWLAFCVASTHCHNSCSVLHPSAHPNPSLQGCSQSIHPTACINTGSCPSQVQDLILSFQ